MNAFWGKSEKGFGSMTSVSFSAVQSSEGGMVLLPTYLLHLSIRFLSVTRSKLECRADDLKIETSHGDKRYRAWLTRPDVANQVTLEQSFAGCDNWIIAHKYIVE